MADEDDSSEDKTEDPTQKRLDQALERGDVAKSQEVNTWFMIAGATLILSTFAGSIGGLQTPLKNVIAQSWMIRTDGAGLLMLAQNLEYAVFVAVGVSHRIVGFAASGEIDPDAPSPSTVLCGRRCASSSRKTRRSIAGNGSPHQSLELTSSR